MAFNKNANWDDMSGQELPKFNLESSMHQKAMPKNKNVSKGLETNMKQPGSRARSFELKSPNKAMKQGQK